METEEHRRKTAPSPFCGKDATPGRYDPAKSPDRSPGTAPRGATQRHPAESRDRSGRPWEPRNRGKKPHPPPFCGKDAAPMRVRPRRFVGKAAARGRTEQKVSLLVIIKEWCLPGLCPREFAETAAGNDESTASPLGITEEGCLHSPRVRTRGTGRPQDRINGIPAGDHRGRVSAQSARTQTRGTGRPQDRINCIPAGDHNGRESAQSACKQTQGTGRRAPRCEERTKCIAACDHKGMSSVQSVTPEIFPPGGMSPSAPQN